MLHRSGKKETFLYQRIEELEEELRQQYEKNRRTTQQQHKLMKHLQLIIEWEEQVSGGHHRSSRSWLFAKAALGELELRVGGIEERGEKILTAGKIAATLEAGKSGKVLPWFKYRSTKK
jgi:hypothetical protein